MTDTSTPEDSVKTPTPDIKPAPRVVPKEPVIKSNVAPFRGTVSTNPPRFKPKAKVVLSRPAGTPLEQSATAQKSQYEKEFDTLIDSGIEHGSNVTVRLIEFLQKYVEDMSPTRIVKDSWGAKRQQQFFQALHTAIEKSDPEEFNQNWMVVLSFFHRYKTGALGIRYVNRFAEFWPEQDDRLTAFQRIINLIILSEDPANRHLVTKRVSLTKTMEVGFTEAGRSNIVQFYSN